VDAGETGAPAEDVLREGGGAGGPDEGIGGANLDAEVEGLAEVDARVVRREPGERAVRAVAPEAPVGEAGLGYARTGGPRVARGRTRRGTGIERGLGRGFREILQ
jgi:hypothetical protein